MAGKHQIYFNKNSFESTSTSFLRRVADYFHASTKDYYPVAIEVRWSFPRPFPQLFPLPLRLNPVLPRNA